MAKLAKSPQQPAKVKMDVRELTNTTSLRWKKPLAGKLTGYNIVIWETYRPFCAECIGEWQRKPSCNSADFEIKKNSAFEKSGICILSEVF